MSVTAELVFDEASSQRRTAPSRPLGAAVPAAAGPTSPPLLVERQQLLGHLGQLLVRTLRSGDHDAIARLNAATRDLAKAMLLFGHRLPLPRLSVAEDGELLLTWRIEGRTIIGSLYGDGLFSYAFRGEAEFEPGEDLQLTAASPGMERFRALVAG